MKNIWIVLANVEHADIYSYSPSLPHKHTLVRSMDHPESKLRNNQLSSDQIGQFSQGTGGHATYQHNNPHQVEVEHFTHEIAQFIDKSRTHNLFEELAIVAGPQMLGKLQDALPAQAQKLVKVKIDKDYLPAIRDGEYTLDEVAHTIDNKIKQQQNNLNR